MSGRSLTAAMLTEIVKDETIECSLLELNFDSGVQRFTTAARDVDWSGNTYVANGNLLKIGDIVETLEMQIHSTMVELSAANQANVASALTDDFLNRKATLYKALINSSSYAVIADPEKTFEGKISNYDVDENYGNGDSKIKWRLSNHFYDFDRINGRLTSDSSHRLLYPNVDGGGNADLFFEFAHESFDSLLWGGEPTSLGSAGGLGGFVSPDGSPTPTGTLSFLKNPTKISKTDNNVPIPVVYGQRRITPIRVFKAVGGGNKQYLDIMYCLAEGECDSIVKIWIDGIESTDSRFSGLIIHQNFHAGTSSETADTDLVANQTNWTSLHRGVDTASLYLRFQWDKDVFHGEPDVDVELKGKKCLEKIGETTAWTSNPAWHNYDYLISTRYGRGIPEAENHEQSFIDAANFFDTSVESYSGGPNHALIAGGAVINTGATLFDNMKLLVNGARSWLTFTGGLWRLIVDKDESTSFTFSEAILAQRWKFGASGKKTRKNFVEVKFENVLKNYKKDVFAIESTTFQTADNGEVLKDRYDYPTIDDYHRAGRYAKYLMNRSRYDLAISHKSDLSSLKVEPGDVVNFQHQTPNWTSTTWRVQKVIIHDSGECSFRLTQHSSNVYTLPTLSAEPAPATNTLPDPSSVIAPTGLNAASGDNELIKAVDGTVIVQTRIYWTASIDYLLSGYELQVKKSADGSYISGSYYPGKDDIELIIQNLDEGTDYDFQIRALNSIKRPSAWVEITNHTVVGTSAPPPDVEQFLVSRQPDGTRQYTWTYDSPPVDHNGFIIKAALGTSLAYSALSMVLGAEQLPPGIRAFENNQLAAGDYTVGIKAVDTSKNESLNAKLINVTLLDPRIEESFVIVDLFADGWSGTKTNCWVPSDLGYLTVSDQNDWTDPATWSVFSAWIQNPFTSIIYQHGTIDIGAIVSFTPLVTITQNGDSITIEEQHSDDDTSYSSWTAVGAIVTARYLRSRFTITKASGIIEVPTGIIILSGTPVIERIEDLDISTLTGANRIAVGHVKIPFAKTFVKFSHAKVVAIQNVGPGWTWELIAKTDLTNGAEIKTYNGSGTLADATIDFEYTGV